MARRGENIRKRKDGRWEGRFIKGYSESGKAFYKSVYALNYADCKDKLLAEKVLFRSNGIKHDTYTGNAKLADIVREWLESIRVKTKYSTYCSERKVMKNQAA